MHVSNSSATQHRGSCSFKLSGQLVVVEREGARAAVVVVVEVTGSSTRHRVYVRLVLLVQCSHAWQGLALQQLQGGTACTHAARTARAHTFVTPCQAV